MKQNSKINQNIVFAQYRAKSVKPDEIYEIIELLTPNCKRLEIFARNNNLRRGWFSLGNQIGDQYEKYDSVYNCNKCQNQITIGQQRFKHKFKKDFDLCFTCYQKQKEQQNFYQIENQTDNVIHEFQSCNNCNKEPILGNRFECSVCHNYDLCEDCININIESQFHDIDHPFNLIEIPKYAEGFPVHKFCCQGCYQKPIIGPRLVCEQCQNFSLCQNCFFNIPQKNLEKRNHKQDHKFKLQIYENQMDEINLIKCFICQKGNLQDGFFKCENCYNFFLCQNCHINTQEN